MRINQFLARSGYSSRRRAEELVRDGLVTVNGMEVIELATQVDELHDQVCVNGKPVRLPQLKYYMLAKPVGYTCTRKDRHAKKTVFELLPDDPTLITVGRLDRDTRGLLLVTNDGDFAQNIIHPSKKIEKEYRIETSGPVTDVLLSTLETGVKLEDGPAKANKAKKTGSNALTLTIEEGRKRIVRRMIESVGNKVVDLERVRIGDIKLDIEEGKYRELTREEISCYA